MKNEIYILLICVAMYGIGYYVGLYRGVKHGRASFKSDFMPQKFGPFPRKGGFQKIKFSKPIRNDDMVSLWFREPGHGWQRDYIFLYQRQAFVRAGISLILKNANEVSLEFAEYATLNKSRYGVPGKTWSDFEGWEWGITVE